MQRGLPWSDGPQQHPDTPPPSPAASRRRLREIAWREAERRAGGGGRRRACHLFSQIRAATAPDANPIAPLFPSLFPVVKSSGASASSSATQHDELGPEATHEPVERHFKIPHGVFMREATSVTVDSDDNCYVFNRGNVPVLVFDPSGNLINDWGNHTPYDGTESCESPWPTDAFNGPGTASPASILRYRGTEYVRPHMIRWSEYDGTLWLVDDMANTITQCDRNGTRLLVLRPKGVVLRTPDDIAQAVGDIAEPPAAQSGEMFNRPTDCCVHPETGDIFIADGYGNSRIHRLKADGSWIMSWGESGTDENQFYCPHNISISDDGTKVLVADRENNRVSVYTTDGVLIDNWPAGHRPAGLCVRDGLVYVAEQQARMEFAGYQNWTDLDSWSPRIGCRVSIYDVQTGKRVQTLGGPTPGERPDQFISLHSIAVDSRGDIYCAEVSNVDVGSRMDPPREMMSLRKWRRC